MSILRFTYLNGYPPLVSGHEDLMSDVIRIDGNASAAHQKGGIWPHLSGLVSLLLGSPDRNGQNEGRNASAA